MSPPATQTVQKEEETFQRRLGEKNLSTQSGAGAISQLSSRAEIARHGKPLPLSEDVERDL